MILDIVLSLLLNRTYTTILSIEVRNRFALLEELKDKEGVDTI